MTHSFPTRRSSDLPAFGHHAGPMKHGRGGHAVDDRTSAARVEAVRIMTSIRRKPAPIVARRRHRQIVERDAPGGRSTGRRHLDIDRSEEHTSELQSIMRISYTVFRLKKKTRYNRHNRIPQTYEV